MTKGGCEKLSIVRGHGSMHHVRGVSLHGLQVFLQEFEHKKNFTWEFVGQLERPRVVRARVAPFNTKENLFAQMVVRIKYMRVCACAFIL